MPSKTDRPLAIVGNLNADLWFQPVRRFPAWDEEVIVDSARVELAGTAGYVLRACKALGIEAVTVSTVGDDLFGRFVRQGVNELGFSTAAVETIAGQETSLGMIFVGDDGRRGILSTLGAHRCLDLAMVRRHDQQVAGCAEVFLCGNYLLPGLSPGRIVDYARAVRARGQLVIFDPSWDPAGWSDQTRADTYSLLQTVDVYLPNAAELMHLTGRHDWRDALSEVEKLPGEVVLKRGPAGAIHAQAGEWTAVPGFTVDAVNTVGAGDIFDVGYLYGVRQGWPPRQRLQFACALAAMVVSQAGPRVYPAAADVIAFLREQTRDATWPTATERRSE